MMITVRHGVMERRRTGTRLAYTTAGAALATVLVSACGSSGHAAASGHAVASGHARTSAVQQTCLQVDAVLSDGPDPGADPVGYAEAQILPLKQIHASDPALSTAISTLAGAYQSYYAASGTGSTVKSALNTAINRINSLCPGAGATT
jgi:hypothetical protein